MQKLDSVLHFPQELIEQLGDGFYNACIAIDSHIPSSKHTKTFFPAHWTREEVMSCVHEKFKNAVRWPDKDKIYKLQTAFVSSYDENVDIVYIFDELQGKFTTIYPSKKLQ